MPSRIRPDGLKVWTDKAGYIHRECGPARKNNNGYEAYFYHGKRYDVVSVTHV